MTVSINTHHHLTDAETDEALCVSPHVAENGRATVWMGGGGGPWHVGLGLTDARTLASNLLDAADEAERLSLPLLRPV